MELAQAGVPLIALRLAAAVSMAAVGAAAAVVLRRISHLWLCVLISFAAGALLAVSLFHILPEAARSAGLPLAAAGLAAGYALFTALSRFVDHVCPACAAGHTEHQFKNVTWTLVAAMSVHSFMDGLAISGGGQAAENVGLLVLAAVAYHKLPEGMALALVARGSGMGRAAAFGLTMALELVTTLAGGLFGALSLAKGQGPWLGLALGFVAGGFVYIVLHALLSEAVKHHPRVTLAAAGLGAASMLALGVLAGSAHVH